MNFRLWFPGGLKRSEDLYVCYNLTEQTNNREFTSPSVIATRDTCDKVSQDGQTTQTHFGISHTQSHTYTHYQA